VLWVDDHPEWVRNEMEALSAIGFDFRMARNNQVATEILETHFFHLIISDIGRSNGPSGLETEDIAFDHAGRVPIIFYVGQSIGPKTPRGNAVVTSPKALFDQIQQALSSYDAV